MTTPWLFLDFDNTLMGTEQYALPSLIERFNRLYQHELDHLLTLQEFKAHFHGQSRETLCQNLSQHFNITVDCQLLYQDREWEMMRAYQKLPHGILMAPHLIETLSTLSSQSFQFALVSNNPIQRAFTAMRYANNGQGATLAQFFETHFFEAGDIQKPKPDVYLRAISQVNANLQNSFAVEDSVTGAKASLAAGLKTIGTTTFSQNPDEHKAKLLEVGCVAVFNNWLEFPALIHSLRAEHAP